MWETEGKSRSCPNVCRRHDLWHYAIPPLLLMIGYCFSQPVPLAGMAGMAFSLSSMVSPVLLLVIVTGALSKKMGSEIPDTVKWFRLASYLLLMVMPFLFTVE